MYLADRLSKSRVQKGLRCPLQLYLSVHHRDLADTVTPEQQALFDTGNRVGDLAQTRYPGGVLIAEDYLHHREAVSSTRSAMEDNASALFEAAFTFDNVKVRVDVLRRLESGGWDLIEVKSTGAYDEAKHLSDAGIQLYVLRGAGVDVRRVSLMHLNKEYVYPGGEYDVQSLLSSTDITDAAETWMADAPELVAGMMEVLALPEPPVPPADVQCSKPYGCEFHGYCAKDAPDHPITELCRRSSGLYAELSDLGIGAVQDIPADVIVGLTRTQQLHYQATIERRLVVEPAVIERLGDLIFPLYFADFETVMPALPIFTGTRPFQILRVQWSMHVLHEDGTLTHREWLASGADDNPDPQFMRTLLDALGSAGTFIHYSAYERSQLVDIAVHHPQFAQELIDLIPGFLGALEEKANRVGVRLDVRPGSGGLLDFDLGMRVVKDGCFHPEMHGGWSIKGAIKAMAPSLPEYESLSVSNGSAAMIATAELLDSSTPPVRQAELREALLEYCRQDTLAMVEIWRTLDGLRRKSLSKETT